MAHTINGKLRGLFAAFVAVLAALALVPAVAYADMPWPTDGEGVPGTGSITITGDDVTAASISSSSPTGLTLMELQVMRW